MQFIYGLLTMAVFFLFLIFAFYLGTRTKQKKPPDKPLDDEIIRKQMKLKEDFLKMMNYDVDTATARKKVT